MKKQILKSIRSKWACMIMNGEKPYEFWNKLPKDLKTGDIVNMYVTKAKPYLSLDNGDYDCNDVSCSYEEYGLFNHPDDRSDKSNIILNGKVAFQFTVGEIYELPIYGCNEDGCEDCNLLNEDLTCRLKVTALKLIQSDIKNIGYTYQRYAIEITNLKVFDEPRELSEYINVKKWDNFYKTFPNYQEIESFIEENVGINNEQYSSGTNYNLPKEVICAITKAPQSFMRCYDSKEAQNE